MMEYGCEFKVVSFQNVDFSASVEYETWETSKLTVNSNVKAMNSPKLR